jgi:HAD superfamily hydrolase (TIGR01509 family)
MLTDAGKPPSDAEVARLIAAKKPLYMELIGDSLVIFEGAAEIVRRRARLGTVGIVSGALRDEIEHALGVMGVREHVAFIVSAEDTRRCKPDPEGYILGARELLARAAPGAPPKNPIVIEDSVAGIQAAKAAGFLCAAVAHSYPADVLKSAGADVVVARIADLTDERLAP